MKIAKLVSASDKLRRINARLVKVVAYRTGVDRKKIPTAVAKTYTPNEYKLGRVRRAKDQNKYVSSIKYLDQKLNVKVSCSCPDYMFRWEYANAQAGAADIIYGNGDPPTETNPSQRIGLCIAKGTKVAIRGGYKLIEQIVVDDFVMTMGGYQRVLAAEHTGYKDVYEIKTLTGTSAQMTLEHPVLIYKEGTPPQFKPLSEISVGDNVCILMRDAITGSHVSYAEPVTSIEQTTTMDVYDLQVEGEEHFTANGIIVHNCKHLLALRDLVKKKHGI